MVDEAVVVAQEPTVGSVAGSAAAPSAVSPPPPPAPEPVRARFPLAWRIFLGTAVVVAAVLGGSLWLTARAAERAATAAAERGIASIRAQVRAQLDGNSQGLLDGARVFAQIPGFMAVLQEGRRDDALDQSIEAAERLDASWVQITDAAGNRLAKSDAPDAPPQPLGGTALIRRALDGHAVAAYGAAGDSMLFHAVAVPVDGATPGRRAGALMATRMLDATAARALGTAAGGDVVFYLADSTGAARLNASTLPDTPALRQAVATLAAASAGAAPTVGIGAERYYGLAMPLQSADGRTLGGVAVLHSQTAELQPFRELERTILLAGAAGLGLALLVSFAIARQITRPLARLAVVARRAASGDYSADSVVRSRDEVGVLAEAFRTMLADLREKQVLVEFARLTPARSPRPASATPSTPIRPLASRPSRAISTVAAPDGRAAALAAMAEGATARVARPESEKGAASPPAATPPPPPAPPPVPAPAAMNAFAAAAALRPGQRFAGRYDIHHMIGAGGAGVVFLATDSRKGEPVALKVLRPDVLNDDPVSGDRLAREVDIARRLSHPNVVRVEELGDADGLHYITMEYVEGTSLRQMIDQRGALPVDVVLSFGKQLCRALDHAHVRGIIHRDIKPHNLVVAPDGTLKVMDFGTARLADAKRGLTESDVLIGTPAYMAPELLRSGPVDARADVYSAGVVLYEALVGRAPFAGGGSPLAILTQALESTPVDPAELNPLVPRELADVVLRALAKKPAQRPQTAAELGAMLAEASD